MSCPPFHEKVLSSISEGSPHKLISQLNLANAGTVFEQKFVKVERCWYHIVSWNPIQVTDHWQIWVKRAQGATSWPTSGNLLNDSKVSNILPWYTEYCGTWSDAMFFGQWGKDKTFEFLLAWNLWIELEPPAVEIVLWYNVVLCSSP